MYRERAKERKSYMEEEGEREMRRAQKEKCRQNDVNFF